jgi:hypothetical protein
MSPEVLALFEVAERYAFDAISWYMRDRIWKSRLSRGLRVAAIILGTAGAATPLVAVAISQLSAEWGFVLIALAAGCYALDRFLGLSSAWMRNITSAFAIQSSILSFYAQWTKLQHEAIDAVSQIQLTLISDLLTSIMSIVQGETDAWLTEFSTNLAELHQFTVSQNTDTRQNLQPPRMQLAPVSPKSASQGRPMAGE